MLLLLRTFPILVALTVIAGSLALFWFPTQPFVVAGLALALLFILLSRLADWNFKKIDAWILLGIPFLLAVSSFFLLLFLEGNGMKILVITLATCLIWLFAENLFTYLHLPAAYQVNALEYLSLVVNVVSVYFFTTALFAVRLFLSAPLWKLVPFFALFVFALTAATFWVCKIEKEKVLVNSLGGTILFCELFVVFSFLPASFFSNAGLLTLFFYLFLGIVRSQLLEKLNKIVLRRYLVTVFIIALLIVWTARWT
ncbi:MAG: hypothetical protein UX09_C0046G0015 [Candidatus Uhrbacteria bacterium GW2011_GWE2_45_35]|uniref:Uncharacterized protein n=2 Tax=Candidatus Uhriibacteriota TaxID=1752732 RepID=A0A0G1JFX5_9BACT|nr:MAG: hypothetical protein UW63_C0031G0006 [Candidatus Uhrbacteria bacterium GW2011_GWF2_44_350]KKU06653.1 MAG: hypothetical protein UX09_C0046G0015 [Candidatus Uhrbacteria bacterium GW2011_GWE2_45_35]HBR80699.1 hypothetical protein [Candidatus Uhrbacteria bacterium]HCU31661.1 hypothetical protein [Candidatus Uhrbacteria bacterium]